MPDIAKLSILADLREARHKTQEHMADYFGMQGRSSRDSVGKWERGQSIPNPRRRSKFIAYLCDELGLRNSPEQLRKVWSILEQEWNWEPLSDEEWQEICSSNDSPSIKSYIESNTVLSPPTANGLFNRPILIMGVVIILILLLVGVNRVFSNSASMINHVNALATPVASSTSLSPLVSALAATNTLPSNWKNPIQAGLSDRIAPCADITIDKILPTQATENEPRTSNQIQILKESMGKDELRSLPLAPQFVLDKYNKSNGNVAFFLYMDITSIVEDRQWLKVGGTISISITVDRKAPEHADVYYSAIPKEGGCGGGKARSFPEVPLSSDNSNYKVQTTYPDVDFFSLQPGEFETFALDLQCKAPGIYMVDISAAYSYLEQIGVATVTKHPLICPKSFTVWQESDNGVIYNTGTYVWEGSKYIYTN